MPTAAADLVAAFGSKLREQKERANLTYRELGRRANYSHAHMMRADRGHELPRWGVAEAYLRACGVRSERTMMVYRSLWESAARSTGLETQAAGGARKVAATAMRSIRTPAEFGEQLRRLAQRGSPLRHRAAPKSLRELAAETKFSKSTLADWFAGNRLPSRDKLQQFTVDIQATQAEITELLEARERLDWAARSDEPPTTTALLLDNLDPDVDRQVIEQLAAVLLRSEDRGDRTAAVRSVGAKAVVGTYSHGPGRHRAAPTDEQLGREQAELERLAERVAEIMTAKQTARLRSPATIPVHKFS